jgi:LmbE family N-acetylglucosaminyl deacetylase
MDTNDTTSNALQRPLIISPHLDDAVFSCGGLIAAADEVTVVTIFAGVPSKAGECATDWDMACGFANAREAIEIRRGEDKRALSSLGARAVWLDFCDSQYRETPDASAIADALMQIVQQYDPAAVVLPAGLFHADHELAHRVALQVRRDRMQSEWLMYEDALYRGIEGLLQRRLAALLADRILATPADMPLAAETESMLPAKLQAAQCYLSQLRGLNTPGRPGYADLQAPERYWRLATVRESKR